MDDGDWRVMESATLVDCHVKSGKLLSKPLFRIVADNDPVFRTVYADVRVRHCCRGVHTERGVSTTIAEATNNALSQIERWCREEKE